MAGGSSRYALLVVAAFIEAEKPEDAPGRRGFRIVWRLSSMLLFPGRRYCTIIREVSLSFKAPCSASWTADQSPNAGEEKCGAASTRRFTSRVFGLRVKYLVQTQALAVLGCLFERAHQVLAEIIPSNWRWCQ